MDSYFYVQFFSGPFAFSAVYLFSVIDVTWLMEQEQLQ